MLFSDTFVVVRGGGDLATGVIYRLHQTGFPVITTEIERPMAIRRTVAFAQAMYDGACTVEGVTAQRVERDGEALDLAARGGVPVLAAPGDDAIARLQPRVLVDARLLKRDSATSLDQAPLVIGLGPGFHGGVNCHAAIETNRGHRLGRVLWDAPTEADTGIPGSIAGYREERIIRATATGVFEPTVEFGDHVERGQEVGFIKEAGARSPVIASLSGVVRGLLHPGLAVRQGAKIGDVDPRDDPTAIYTISDKSLAIGGAVLTAILMWMNRRSPEIER